MVKRKQFTLGFLVLFVVLLVLASFTSVFAAEMLEMESRELKLLVHRDVFKNRIDGYALCWGIAKELAGDMGIGVTEAEDPFDEGARQVLYLDTPSGRLNKEQLTLRVRIKFKKGKFEDIANLNLKWREKYATAAPAGAVFSLDEYGPKNKLEEDIAGFTDGLIGNNVPTGSMGCTIKKIPVEKFSGYTVGEFAELYPSLKKLGIPGATKLQLTSGVAVMEYTIAPGELDFGHGMVKEFEMSVWYNYDTDELVIAEVSFESDYGPDAPAEAVEKAVAFFNVLQDRMGSILVPGGMKTQYLRDSVK